MFGAGRPQQRRRGASGQKDGSSKAALLAKARAAREARGVRVLREKRAVLLQAFWRGANVRIEASRRRRSAFESKLSDAERLSSMLGIVLPAASLWNSLVCGAPQLDAALLLRLCALIGPSLRCAGREFGQELASPRFSLSISKVVAQSQSLLPDSALLAFLSALAKVGGRALLVDVDWQCKLGPLLAAALSCCVEAKSPNTEFTSEPLIDSRSLLRLALCAVHGPPETCTALRSLVGDIFATVTLQKLSTEVVSLLGSEEDWTADVLSMDWCAVGETCLSARGVCRRTRAKNSFSLAIHCALARTRRGDQVQAETALAALAVALRSRARCFGAGNEWSAAANDLERATSLLRALCSREEETCGSRFSSLVECLLALGSALAHCNRSTAARRSLVEVVNLGSKRVGLDAFKKAKGALAALDETLRRHARANRKRMKQLKRESPSTVHSSCATVSIEACSIIDGAVEEEGQVTALRREARRSKRERQRQQRTAAQAEERERRNAQVRERRRARKLREQEAGAKAEDLECKRATAWLESQQSSSMRVMNEAIVVEAVEACAARTEIVEAMRSDMRAAARASRKRERRRALRAAAHARVANIREKALDQCRRQQQLEKQNELDEERRRLNEVKMARARARTTPSKTLRLHNLPRGVETLGEIAETKEAIVEACNSVLVAAGHGSNAVVCTRDVHVVTKRSLSSSPEDHCPSHSRFALGFAFVRFADVNYAKAAFALDGEPLLRDSNKGIDLHLGIVLAVTWAEDRDQKVLPNDRGAVRAAALSASASVDSDAERRREFLKQVREREQLREGTEHLAERERGGADDPNESTCLVCCETITPSRCIGVPPCGHAVVCGVCCLRRRELYDDTSCPLCKREANAVFISHSTNGGDTGSAMWENLVSRNIWGDPDDSFCELASIATSSNVLYDDSSRSFLHGEAAVALAHRLRGFACLLCEHEADSLVSLKAHLSKEHGGVSLCEVCLKANRVFVGELARLTPSQLSIHCSQGLPSERALLGFGGHPRCSLCDHQAFDDCAMREHLHAAHLMCRVCCRLNPHDADSSSHGCVFFRDRSALVRHAMQHHFVCNVCEAASPGTAAAPVEVFQHESGLRGHMLTCHPSVPCSRRVEVGFRVLREHQGGLSGGDTFAESMVLPPTSSTDEALLSEHFPVLSSATNTDFKAVVNLTEQTQASQRISVLDHEGEDDSETREEEEFEDSDVWPDELCCPLTLEPFVDPVRTCDGAVYERAPIEVWFAQHLTSPFSNLPLETLKLVPATDVAAAVDVFARRLGTGESHVLRVRALRAEDADKICAAVASDEASSIMSPISLSIVTTLLDGFSVGKEQLQGQGQDIDIRRIERALNCIDDVSTDGDDSDDDSAERNVAIALFPENLVSILDNDNKKTLQKLQAVGRVVLHGRGGGAFACCEIAKAADCSLVTNENIAENVLACASSSFRRWHGHAGHLRSFLFIGEMFVLLN